MERKNLLLVEGETDKRVIEAIAGNLENTEILVARGFPRLCDQIRFVIPPANREYLGIVFDANGDPKEQWSKIRNAILTVHCKITEEQPDMAKLDKAKLKKRLEKEIPETLVAKIRKGVWVENYKPWISKHKSNLGLWMMPDNGSAGELEDLLFEMICEDHCWQHAREYVEKISKQEQRFQDHKTKKANVYAWLAVQENPGGPSGQSIAKAMASKYLNIDISEAQPFRQWLGKIQGTSNP